MTTVQLGLWSEYDTEVTASRRPRRTATRVRRRDVRRASGAFSFTNMAGASEVFAGTDDVKE
jgi:hypothetical protein